MFPTMALWLRLLLTAASACAITFLMTPPVKRFAEKLGVLDVPRDERRVHCRPVPRMGGLAIFLGLILSLLLFEEMSVQILGLLTGAVIITAMGTIDDIVDLKPWIKFLIQIVAAVVAVRSGIVMDRLSGSVLLSGSEPVDLGFLSVPLTLLWIVGCTNAVNLIDGLDGLAVGVSGISSATMLAASIAMSEPVAAVILAAMTGSCLGFIPYNHNPAKIFMGDAGAQLLGYVLAVASLLGMFKFHAAITFLVPLLALAVPLTDTASAFFRRVLHGQSPFQADRKHLHHQLLAMGMSQKQAVALLYCVSAFLGLIAVLLCESDLSVRVLCLAGAVALALLTWFFLLRRGPCPRHAHEGAPRAEKKPDP